MSPVRPSGGESLQEMIDRYNRELMEMGGAGSRHTDSEKKESHSTAPDGGQAHSGGEGAGGQTRRMPRPEPSEPLYGSEQRPLRPEAAEPLDEPRTPEAIREYNQGIEDIRQGQRDREQGLRDIHQAQLDRKQGERDIHQAQLDREQGLRDIRQGQHDRHRAQWAEEQGARDMKHAREDLTRGLEELREGLRELEQLQKEYLAELHRQERGRVRKASANDPFGSPAVSAAAAPESQREQWLRDLEQGRLELEQGLRDLEQGLRDKEQGVREYEQGLAEREYWLSQSRQVTAPVSAQPVTWQNPMPPQPRRNPDGTVPIEPTVPGRVTAQSQPGEQPAGGGSGTLIVQVYTARRAEPVAGAQVVVTLPADGGEVLYKIMRTDIDGRTPPLQLPVEPAREGSVPYAVYRVYVTADNYLSSGALNAQIFPGVTGVLPVELIPGKEAGF